MEMGDTTQYRDARQSTRRSKSNVGFVHSHEMFMFFFFQSDIIQPKKRSWKFVILFSTSQFIGARRLDGTVRGALFSIVIQIQVSGPYIIVKLRLYINRLTETHTRRKAYIAKTGYLRRLNNTTPKSARGVTGSKYIQQTLGNLAVR